MKIVSNNTIKLEEVYTSLREDGKADKFDLNKVPVEGAMGFEVELIVHADVILNFDVHELIADMFKSYLGYRFMKKVFIKNKPDEPEHKIEEIIDVEVLTDKEKVKNLNIDNDTVFEIEYKER